MCCYAIKTKVEFFLPGSKTKTKAEGGAAVSH